MKISLLLLTLVVIGGSSIDPQLDQEWLEWLREYRPNARSSANDGDINNKRREIWETRHARILKHNQEAKEGKHTYTMGHNEFSDLTFDEFAQKFLGAKDAPRRTLGNDKQEVKGRFFSAPFGKDWRTEGTGFVNPVRDQAQCGCCWAFAACGALEGAYYKKTQVAKVFSPQQLVDCDRGNDNEGCGGGMPERAFDYFIRNGALPESEYPYESGADGEPRPCSYNKTAQREFAVPMSGWKYTSTNSMSDEDSLTRAINDIGPIAVAIYVNDAFQSYQAGVFADNACTVINPNTNTPSINHAVVAVGFGTDLLTNTPYYILKNQWGTTWGMAGYMHLARNRGNMCNVAAYASYPTGVNSANLHSNTSILMFLTLILALLL